jgi:CRP-like cAMP-binding protein
VHVRAAIRGEGEAGVEGVNARGVLAAIPLFADTLDARQLDHLAAQSREVLFPAGAVLMSEGDFGDSMFAVVEGEADVTLHDQRGGEHKVTSVKPGEIVGEMALLTGLRRQATVVARTQVTALEITKPVLEEMFARAPELIDRFGAVLAERQAILDKVAADAASRKDFASRIRWFFGGR